MTSVQHQLSKESIDAVKHYLTHDEFEMAFEGLFLEIMQLNKVPEIDLDLSRAVGILLKLNEETVFDYQFWNKFEKYIERNHKNIE